MPLADAMTLATVGADGAPDARMVLLKGHGPDGFRFFTNYESAKAGQIAADPRGALILYWREHDRQVRARGTFERLPAADSDAYFASRARESRLGAWASPQSRPLADRAELDRRLAEVRERFADVDDVPRPDFWGGFRPAPGDDRVLAGTAGPPPRPLRLLARRRGRLADPAPRPLRRRRDGRADRTRP